MYALITRNVHSSTLKCSSIVSTHQPKESIENTHSNSKRITDRADSTQSNRYWLKSFPKRDSNVMIMHNYLIEPSNFIIELKPKPIRSMPVRNSVSNDELVYLTL